MHTVRGFDIREEQGREGNWLDVRSAGQHCHLLHAVPRNAFMLSLLRRGKKEMHFAKS